MFLSNSATDSTSAAKGTTGWVSPRACFFPGLRSDGNSGDLNVRNRDYRPTLGRWTSMDPAGYVDGLNAYQFGGSLPTSGRDPYGLSPLDRALEKARRVRDSARNAAAAIDDAAARAKVAAERVRSTAEDVVAGAKAAGQAVGAYTREHPGVADTVCLVLTAAAPPAPDPCTKLLERIKQLLGKVVYRWQTQRNKPYILKPGGEMSEEGHETAFDNDHRGLRNLLQEWNTKGCKGELPENAWRYATVPYPTPAPDANPQPWTPPSRKVTADEDGYIYPFQEGYDFWESPLGATLNYISRGSRQNGTMKP
jgi:RHS repeat-associated protein